MLVPVVVPAHHVNVDVGNAQARQVVFHHAQHALREIAGNDGVSLLRERSCQRTGAATHVEYRLAGFQRGELEEPLSISMLRAVLHGEGFRPFVPHRGVVEMLPCRLELLPLLVPVGRGQQGSENRVVVDCARHL